MKFFVMIYAYRDLELPKTVNNIFAMADNPKDINIGIISFFIINFLSSFRETNGKRA